ncbi:MAG: hypothetical protein H7A32_00180 [Deltaproteobacteria bacterium]|nr:hypothetical protein [Deltaproteobacteria bacterium]
MSENRISEYQIKWGGTFSNANAALQEYFQDELNKEYGAKGPTHQNSHKLKHLDILKKAEIDTDGDGKSDYMIAEALLFTQKKSLIKGIEFFADDLFILLDKEGRVFIWDKINQPWKKENLQYFSKLNSSHASIEATEKKAYKNAVEKFKNGASTGVFESFLEAQSNPNFNSAQSLPSFEASSACYIPLSNLGNALFGLPYSIFYYFSNPDKFCLKLSFV